MKVSLIVERLDESLGGAERSVNELAAGLRKAGLEVDILAAKSDRKDKGVYPLCSGIKGKRVGFEEFGAALEKYLAKNRYDIVHSVLPFGFADVYQPRGGSYKETQIRNAASYRSGLVRCWKRITGFANFRRFVLMRAERKICQDNSGPTVAALSRYVKRQFQNHYGLADERIAVIANGVDVDGLEGRMDADIGAKAQILEKFGIEAGGKEVVFLFAANNFRLKGLGCLIEAFAKLPNELQASAFVIAAGRGKQRKYRKLAERLSVEDRVCFAGAVDGVKELLAAADVAVLPSFYDPSSRFIIEALAGGVPVITSRYNGAVDLFEDGRHGAAIGQLDDLGELAEAMKFFCDAVNITNAKENIKADNLKDKVSIARHCRELVGLYEKILERKAGR